ncbi:hypothetical protein THAOC_11122, partial [Thalassiosira oceanica]
MTTHRTFISHNLHQPLQLSVVFQLYLFENDNNTTNNAFQEARSGR